MLTNPFAFYSIFAEMEHELKASVFLLCAFCVRLQQVLWINEKRGVISMGWNKVLAGFVKFDYEIVENTLRQRVFH